MKSAILASLLSLILVGAPCVAHATTPDASRSTRYFLQTTKPFWRSALGARHVFNDGFTANLSGLQLSVAKFAGLRPLAVKNFTILAEASPSPDLTATPKPRSKPADTVPWGVRSVLGNLSTVKTAGGQGVTVAVLDTGVDREHPDLKSQIEGCADYTDVAKALIDDQCDDANGHGTHVAGIIAADGGPDGHGLSGVAPQAKLLVYRVCNRNGNCLSDDIAVALRDAVDAGAQVIVLGLGGEAASSFIDDAITYATSHDVMVVAAAGNDGPYQDSLDWPARNPAVVSVGAMASDGTVADFSSQGDLDLVAPGVNVESTFKDGSYAILSGTSMAAAHVAGLAALEWQKDQKHPAQATRALLDK